MLIVKSHDNEIYTILDTDDMALDCVSKDELLGILRQGLTIYGASEFSLEHNIDLTLILRLYDKSTIKDYDGLILRDYSAEYNMFSTQILDWRELSDTVPASAFSTIINIIKDNNKVVRTVPTNYPVGYKVFSFGDYVLTLEDLATNELYTCDFYTCLYIYFDEHKSIEGVDEVTVDYIRCGDRYYTADEVLIKFKDSSKFSNIKVGVGTSSIVSDIEYDDFQTDWGSINYDFGNCTYLNVTDCKFPIYNIKSRIKRIEGDGFLGLGSMFKTLSSVAYKFENNTLYFRDNSVISKAVDLIRFKNVILYENDEVKNLVFKYLDTIKGKELVFKKDLGYKRNISLSYVVNDSQSFRCPSYRINDVTKPNICIVRTDLGLIYVDKSTLFPIDFAYDNIFLSRISNCGTCWFSPSSGLITVGTAKELNSARTLYGKSFLDLCINAMDLGLAYHNNTIIPLGLARVNIVEGYASITVYCLVLGDKDCNNSYGFNVVEVPLLFIGASLLEYDNYFLLRGLLTNIYLEKSIIYNLEGYFSEDSFLDVWSGLNLKKGRLAYNVLYNNSKSVLRSAVDNDDELGY